MFCERQNDALIAVQNFFSIGEPFRNVSFRDTAAQVDGTDDEFRESLPRHHGADECQNEQNEPGAAKRQYRKCTEFRLPGQPFSPMEPERDQRQNQNEPKGTFKDYGHGIVRGLK